MLDLKNIGAIACAIAPRLKPRSSLFLYNVGNAQASYAALRGDRGQVSGNMDLSAELPDVNQGYRSEKNTGIRIEHLQACHPIRTCRFHCELTLTNYELSKRLRDSAFMEGIPFSDN